MKFNFIARGIKYALIGKMFHDEHTTSGKALQVFRRGWVG